MTLKERYDAVQREVRTISPQATLIAVSKTQPVEVIRELYGFGHRDFGENYVQELIAKASALPADIRWHFIGHLQTNKVKTLLPHVCMVHSVDSERLAKKLDEEVRRLGRNRLPVCLEVNLDASPTKSGCTPQETPTLAQAVSQLAGLDLRGLMVIPEPERPDGATLAFQTLRELELTTRPFTHGVLSMGMSQDYRAALLQGATHVRVGTSIFGPRAAR